MSDTNCADEWETSPTDPFVRARPRVLVAEDDVEMRRMVAGRLRRDGCEVLEVGSGDDAMTAMKAIADHRSSFASELELVIMDVRMPGLSGVEVTGALRAWKWTTPVLLMTAYPDPELIDAASRLGAAVLAKPFGLARLSRAVVDAIAPRSAP